MRIRGIAAVAGIVAGLVVVSGATLVGAHVALDHTASVKAFAEPSPILGPITPAGHPYDELAILRRQRMSDDVMPADVTADISRGSAPSILPASARLVASSGRDRTYLVVEASGGVCLFSTTLGQDGFVSGCNSSLDGFAPGSQAIGNAGGPSSGIEVVTDGTPQPGAVDKGYRQVAPNIWMGRKSHAAVPVVSSGDSDPLAFPPTHPYSDFGILRRGRVASDAFPAAVSKQLGDSGDGPTAIASTSRFAGRFRGVSVWVAADNAGGVCLVTFGASGSGDPGASTGCADSPAGSGVGTGYGSGKTTVNIELESDHQDTSPGQGAVRLAPNVWVLVGRM